MLPNITTTSTTTTTTTTRITTIRNTTKNKHKFSLGKQWPQNLMDYNPLESLVVPSLDASHGKGANRDH